MGGPCSTYGGRGKLHTGFWWGNLRERGHQEQPSIGGKIVLKWIFKKWNSGTWTGLTWLRKGTGGRL